MDYNYDSHWQCVLQLGPGPGLGHGGRLGRREGGEAVPQLHHEGGAVTVAAEKRKRMEHEERRADGSCTCQLVRLLPLENLCKRF